MALISYEEILQILYAKRRFHSNVDLNTVRHCLHQLGDPDRAYPIVHIAGSNGKGHVATMIAKALEESGYKVGLFTSPHLFDFGERIMMNGKMIPKEKVVELYSLLEKLPYSLIFFEFVTLMGLIYFRDEKVDVAVIEAGIGGEYDTTNAISPILSVITSISLEHCERLGPTLEDIATHKAGIIKPQTPVVLGVNAKQNVLFDKAKDQHSPVYAVEGNEPFYQLENQKCAQKALEILSTRFSLTAEAVALGLDAKPRFRFEQRGNYIFDVAHNPDGFYRLAQALHYHHPNQSFNFIVGMGKDKDIAACLAHIEPYIAHIHFVCDGREESATTDQLAEIFTRLSHRSFSKEPSIQTAMKKTVDTHCVVCGSFYFMSAIKEF